MYSQGLGTKSSDSRFPKHLQIASQYSRPMIEAPEPARRAKTSSCLDVNHCGFAADSVVRWHRFSALCLSIFHSISASEEPVNCT